MRPVDIGLFLLFAPSYLFAIVSFFCGRPFAASIIGLFWFFGTMVVHAIALHIVDSIGMRKLDEHIKQRKDEVRQAVSDDHEKGSLAVRKSGSLTSSESHIAPQIEQIIPYNAFHQPALKRFKSRHDGLDTTIFYLQFFAPLLIHCIYSAGNAEYQPVIATDDMNQERLYLYKTVVFNSGTKLPVFYLCSADVDDYQVTLLAHIAYVTGGNKFMPWNTHEYNVQQPLENPLFEGIFAKVFQAYDAVKMFFHEQEISEVLEMAKMYVDRPNEYLKKAGLSLQQPSTNPSGEDEDGNIFTTTKGKGSQTSARRTQGGINKI